MVYLLLFFSLLNFMFISSVSIREGRKVATRRSGIVIASFCEIFLAMRSRRVFTIKLPKLLR